ncbi:DUF2584 family protein [Bacillus fonticola]|uniref:DUF2584 family protein n=1 Tax=Bacillus fonticola TaxID=2728853 RepID=UPI001475F6F0|nr:DUF2584 family protein [Bacillus fonticola]
MRVTWETKLVTEGKAKRLKQNTFELLLDGYHLFPIGEELTLYKTAASEPSGTATVSSLKWEADQTVLRYELHSLHSTN